MTAGFGNWVPLDNNVMQVTNAVVLSTQIISYFKTNEFTNINIGENGITVR